MQRNLTEYVSIYGKSLKVISFYASKTFENSINQIQIGTKKLKKPFNAKVLHHSSQTHWCLRSSSLIQRTNGSPLKPSMQLQIGLWLTTWQRAFWPHVPGHGSLHFWLMHDLSWGHSELRIHSGRQFGGAPIISGKQLHTACWSNSRHWLFTPHGDGWQGLTIGTSSTTDVEYENHRKSIKTRR